VCELAKEAFEKVRTACDAVSYPIRGRTTYLKQEKIREKICVKIKDRKFV
jgi:hypothetical protein